MPNRIRLSHSDSLNSQNFRVLASGISLDRFYRNPVMFFNHRRYDLPIGRWKDIQQSGQELSALPEFYTKNEENKQISDMYNEGFLNAASISIRILEKSEDPDLMLPGQRYPTVTKCELMEASIVSLPADSQAVRLFDQAGNEIDMADQDAVALAFSSLQPKSKKMADTKESKGILASLAGLFAKKGISEEEVEKALSGTEEPDPDDKKDPSPTVADLSTRLDKLNKELLQRDTKIEELEAKLLVQQEAKEKKQGTETSEEPDVASLAARLAKMEADLLGKNKREAELTAEIERLSDETDGSKSTKKEGDLAAGKKDQVEMLDETKEALLMWEQMYPDKK